MLKLKNIICFSIIIAIFIFLNILINNGKESTFVENGITYALTVNGAKQNSFPSKGMYRVDTNCKNATCKWDYDAWKLYIDDIKGNISCNIVFTTISKSKLNDYVIGLSGTEQGTGQVINEKGYRYQGQDPNNYIWFNNEMWRIIGVFGSESHGIANTNLVKIIKETSIGGLGLDKSQKNNWSTSSLKALLNTEYLNSQNGTNGDNCYGGGSTSKAKCDYTTNGIKDIYRSMIKEVTWYLGGHSIMSVTTEEMYGYERGTTVYSGNPISLNAKIGLMYISDYGYAVQSTNCSRDTTLNSYGSKICTLNNWLYGVGEEWVFTHKSIEDNINFYFDATGNISLMHSFAANAVRPVLYLDSSVYVLDGDGSESDPYIIAM